MRSYKLIEALSNAKGISGFEHEVVEVSESFVEEGLTVCRAGLGNFYIFRDRDERDHDQEYDNSDGDEDYGIGTAKPVLLLDAHSDELGFMVQSITSKGLLKVVPVGSWDPRNIPAHTVLVFTEKHGWIKGVFASKPPHFMMEAERGKATTFDQLLLDVGASSKKEAVEIFDIHVGAPIVPDVRTEVIAGGKLMGKAFDNRMGCALVIDLMNHFKDKELAVDLVGALSAQEEVGTRGAAITSFDIEPDACIVFEGTPADDTFTDADEIQGGIGLGSQIRHRDNSMISNPVMTRFAVKIARMNEIAHQEAVRTGGGTNGGVYHMANQGIPSIVLGVPVRYAHTHHGISSYSDYEATFQWACRIIEHITASDIAEF